MSGSQNPSNVSPVSRRGFLKTSAVAAAAATALHVPAVHAAADEKIKVGLIGCGGRGRGACGDVLNSDPNVQVVAIGDLFQDRLDQTVREFSRRPRDKFDVGDRAFVGWDAYQKVIATDCNYIVTATPPAFRPMIIEAAVKAGKHVFGEKPFAVDPVGVRKVLAAAELAKEKNVGILAGTQRRHQPAYVEIIKRIQDGAIGDIVSMAGYWLGGELWSAQRQPEMSDMEWQVRNWLYFTWASGDHIVEQHMHQIDVACWVFGGPPRQCVAMGGRQKRVDPQFGHIYDHFAVEYEFPNGARYHSYCRQQADTYGRVSELIVGTKGRAIPESRIELYGQAAPLYRYRAPGDETVQTNPYVLEHTDFIRSIRAGAPLNEGKQCAESTLAAIMGRMAGYSGKIVQWRFALEDSKEDLLPAKLEFGPLPVPPVAIPGRTPLV
jgi:predicted dehydrogenase